MQLLDYPTFFDLINLPLPDNRLGILNRLEEERLVLSTKTRSKWTITNLGAILFAKKLKSFRHLERKTVRAILYKNNARIDTIKEIETTKGYANGFHELISNINSLLPSNEVIGSVFRKTVTMYPEIAVRELVANAIIHQDLSETGTSPMVEIFSNRLEITNPGVPIIDVIRFLDTPPKSRNELIAAFMRRVGLCEERGSGIDKVVLQTEIYQLPAPEFTVIGNHTRVTLFAHKEFNEMNTEERVRACYLHCCLKYVTREPMNNTSLRTRFNLGEENSASISRVISQTTKNGLIKVYDVNANRKSLRYIPFWA